MKYFWHKDTILATLALFLLMGLLALIPLNTHLFDPIKLAFHDFEFNDLLYSKLKGGEQKKLNDDVVVVNIEEANRAQIAQAVKTISAARPKVIGMDILFEEPKDSLMDAELASVIRNTRNLVLATKLAESEQPKEHSYFLPYAAQSGYINFVGEEGGVIRSFAPFVPETKATSFTARILNLSDPEAFAKLQARENKVEYITYSHRPEQWPVLNISDLAETTDLAKVVQNKIVLLGYVNYSENQIEDKHFTPLNSQFTGKARPDMNGVFIHANILEMLLHNQYVHKIPAWLNWIIAFVIVWAHMAFFIKYYLENHLWFHLIAKTIQVISAIIFVFLGLYLYATFHLKLNMTMALAGIILAVDVIYFYEAFMIWLNKKYGVKSIFHGHQHH